MHWTASRRVHQTRERPHGRTEQAAGGRRVCAALAVTSRRFDSWRTEAAERRRRPRRGATARDQYVRAAPHTRAPVRLRSAPAARVLSLRRSLATLLHYNL